MPRNRKKITHEISIKHSVVLIKEFIEETRQIVTKQMELGKNYEQNFSLPYDDDSLYKAMLYECKILLEFLSSSRINFQNIIWIQHTNKFKELLRLIRDKYENLWIL